MGGLRAIPPKFRLQASRRDTHRSWHLRRQATCVSMRKTPPCSGGGYSKPSGGNKSFTSHRLPLSRKLRMVKPSSHRVLHAAPKGPRGDRDPGRSAGDVTSA